LLTRITPMKAAATHVGADCLDKLMGFCQPRRRYKDLNPGQGKENPLSVFSSPLSDLQSQGLTTERKKGNVHVFSDSA
jgi:hypothetical protein